MGNFTVTRSRPNTNRNATGALDTDEDGMNCRAIRHHHGNAFTTLGFGSKDR
jgi:hypothetical protein